MPFREKTAWISFLSTAAIYAVYFWALRHGSDVFGGLLGTVIALVVVQVVLTIAVAVSAPDEAKAPRDEREKLIELRATRVAYAGLATSVAMACFFGGFEPPVVFNANALLFLLVAAELLRSGCQIALYRRDA
jgi:hypothetical protein